jgi:hypothetical protein
MRYLAAATLTSMLIGFGTSTDAADRQRSEISSDRLQVTEVSSSASGIPGAEAPSDRWATHRGCGGADGDYDHHVGCCGEVTDLGSGVIEIGTLNIIPATEVGKKLLLNHNIPVVFEPETSPNAPAGPTVYASLDGARPDLCLQNPGGLVFSGQDNPNSNDFRPPEVFEFMDHGDEPLCVRQVRLSEGHNDEFGTVFVEAYDKDGNLLGCQKNDSSCPEPGMGLCFGVITLEFFDENTDEPLIHYVRVTGEQDTAGAAINCITFSAPVPCEGAIAVDGTTWGTVKSLYR